MRRSKGTAFVGVLLVSAHGARLAQWTDGRVEDVERFAFGPENGGERDLRGPAHAHPRGTAGTAPGVRSSQQRDLHEHRLLVHRQAELEHIAGEVGAIAGRRGWQAVLVTGDPRLTHAAVRSLHAAHVATRESAKVLDHHSCHVLERELAEDVGALLQERRHELARHA